MTSARPCLGDHEGGRHPTRKGVTPSSRLTADTQHSCLARRSTSFLLDFFFLLVLPSYLPPCRSLHCTGAVRGDGIDWCVSAISAPIVVRIATPSRILSLI